MAGLMLAAAGVPGSLHLTDGNPTVVKAIKRNIDLNRSRIPSTLSVSAEQLLFASELAPEFSHLNQAFDVVFAADCTVNPEIHQILASTIRQILVPGGVFIYLAPKRGKSLGKFIKLAKLDPELQVDTNVQFDENVLQAHHRLQTMHEEKYDEKKNYPILVTIRRRDHANPETASLEGTWLDETEKERRLKLVMMQTNSSAEIAMAVLTELNGHVGLALKQLRMPPPESCSVNTAPESCSVNTAPEVNQRPWERRPGIYSSRPQPAAAISRIRQRIAQQSER